MSKPESRLSGYWLRFFLFNLCLVLLQPEVVFNFLLFLPGYLLPMQYAGAKSLLYLWLGWAYFSALFSPGFPSSLLALGHEFVLVTAGFYAGLYSRQDRRWVWVLFFIGFLMVGLIFIQAAAAPPYPPGWAGPAERAFLPFRVTGLWKNPNRTGLFLAFLLPILVAFLEAEGALTRRTFLPGALLVLTVPALLFTYSRTAWAAALVSLVFYWGPRQKEKLRRLFGVGLLLFGFFPSVSGRIGRNPFHSATMLYRYRIWQETWALVQKYPWTGGGGNMLRAALHPLQAEHAHNHFLQLAAEKGLPAVLLFTGVVYRLLRTPLCPGDWGEDRCFRRGVQSALLGWVVAGLTESLWVVPLDLFLFWFGLAYVTAGRKTMTGEEARMPQQDGGA
ncbi:MAG: O-antigen ligase family protein [Firmicutes bacterium]|nr:O-antigen ligase family protein [Bacillota bacterium]